MPMPSHESNISMPPDANKRLWAAARDEVHDIGRETLALASFDDVRVVAEAASRLTSVLPDCIMEPARSFAEAGNDQGFIVVSGVEPPEELVQTFPKDRKLPTTIAAGAGKLVAATLSAAVGPPITYSDNPVGPEAFIRLVAPEPAFESSRSTANAIDTGWHCEVSSTFRPRAFGLYCVRPQAGVTTRVISPKRLIESLNDNDRELLGQSRFATHMGFSASEPSAPSPIITETVHGTMLAYDSDWSKPYTPSDQEASAVLDRLARLLGDASLWSGHEIHTGEELFIDNFGLHRRGGFTPDYSYPRMLFRVFIGGDWHRDSAPVTSLT